MITFIITVTNDITTTNKTKEAGYTARFFVVNFSHKALLKQMPPLTIVNNRLLS